MHIEDIIRTPHFIQTAEGLIDTQLICGSSAALKSKGCMNFCPDALRPCKKNQPKFAMTDSQASVRKYLKVPGLVYQAANVLWPAN